MHLTCEKANDEMYDWIRIGKMLTMNEITRKMLIWNYMSLSKISNSAFKRKAVGTNCIMHLMLK